MRQPKEPSANSNVFLVVMLIILAVVVTTCTIARAADRTDRLAPGSEELRLDACYMAEEFVEQRLKAPSTADFENCYDATISFIAPNTYVVLSYVDSQNSFGAMLRSNYRAALRYDGDDGWILLNLTIS